MPHAAEPHPSAESLGEGNVPNDDKEEMPAAADSREAPDAGHVPPQARASESQEPADRVLPAKNGIKEGHSPSSSLSLHPTSSDSEEGLAMGQRMQQLAPSESEVRPPLAYRIPTASTQRLNGNADALRGAIVLYLLVVDLRRSPHSVAHSLEQMTHATVISDAGSVHRQSLTMAAKMVCRWAAARITETVPPSWSPSTCHTRANQLESQDGQPPGNSRPVPTLSSRVNAAAALCEGR